MAKPYHQAQVCLLMAQWNMPQQLACMMVNCMQVCLLMAQWNILGYDSTVNISEETVDAESEGGWLACDAATASLHAGELLAW